MPIEVEIRALLQNRQDIEKCLLEQGFIGQPPINQVDTVLDYPDARLFKSGQAIRLRVENGQAVLAYKGQFQSGDTVSRRVEIESPLALSAVAPTIEIFTALGFPLLFQVHKQRTIYKRDGIKVTFDEWPIIGCLMEIEGPEDDIKAVAKTVAPEVNFSNLRLKEIFKACAQAAGKPFSQLVVDYEAASGQKLGRLDLLLS